MKLFQVFLKALVIIFRLKMEGMQGFFVSVLAQAPSCEEAIDIAYHKLINSQKYQESFLPDKHPNGRLRAEECIEILEVDPSIPEISGFVFYPEDNTEENETITH